MKDFNTIKSLIGENLTEQELEYVDCYVHNKVGLFIPSTGQCRYASRNNHSHPAYMVTIIFSDSENWNILKMILLFVKKFLIILQENFCRLSFFTSLFNVLVHISVKRYTENKIDTEKLCTQKGVEIIE